MRFFAKYGCPLALALLAAWVSTATTPVATPAPPPTEAPSVALPSNAEGVQLVAKVNDAEITVPEFESALARFQQQGLTAADPQALEASVLDTLIEQKIIDQAAASENIVVTDAEIQTELDALRQELGGDNAAWQKWLSDNLYTEDEFRQTLRDMLLTGRVRDFITAATSDSVLQVHARHILVGTQAEAEAVMQRLQNGEDFAALAAQLSRDVTTRDQGGDLGWFAPEELLEPALAQVAFALEPGQMAGPVATSLGFHVIQSLERGERPIPEDKRASVAQYQFERWLMTQVQNATIERYR